MIEIEGSNRNRTDVQRGIVMKCAVSALGIILFILCLFGFGLQRADAATTWYVDDNAPADFSTIQAALDASWDGDTIIVRDGTYTGAGNRDIDFNGKAVHLRSENGPDLPRTQERKNFYRKGDT